MTEFIKFSDVIIPEDRIRKKFGEEHIKALADSLESKGYIHPITLRNDSNVLVAGENRYRAHHFLLDSNRSVFNCADGDIPVSRVADLSNDDLLEAELEENLLRSDLTWQEETEAIAKLHAFRKKHNIDWTFADTANEIKDPESGPAQGRQRTKVSEALVIAEHLDDPLIANAKTKKDAIKAIKDKNKHFQRAKAVEAFDDMLSMTPEFDANLDDLLTPEDDNALPASKLPQHQLILGNFFDEIGTIPDETYDIILTDPPYGIDIHRKGTFDSDVHEYDDSKDYFDEIISILAQESFRVAKDEAHIYVFCDIRRWQDIDQAFFATGWDGWPRPLIWHKGNIGSFANADIGPRSTYECIFYAIKGRRPVQHNDMDVILVNQSTRTDHPANKPVELFSNLLQRSAFPGDKVIDFFCGSGPIFPAATEHNCFATGIELNPKYHAIAHERLMETIKK